MIAGRPRRVALGLLALGAASLVYESLILRDPSGRIAGGNGDPLLVAYIVTWVAEQLGTLSVWNPPFFHPAPNVLAYSEHLFGLAVLAWPAVMAGISPIVLVNTISFLAFLLTGIALFFWLLDDREPVLPALAAALTVTFGAWRAQQLAHPQLLFTPFLPLALLCYGRAIVRPSFAGDDGRQLRRGRPSFAGNDGRQLRKGRPSFAGDDGRQLRRGRPGWMWLGAVALTLQTFCTPSLSLFMLPLVTFWIIVSGIVALRRDARHWIGIAASLAAVGLANLPFAVHYWAEGGSLERSPVEIARFSVTWVDWVSAAPTHWLYGRLLAFTSGWERVLFPGLGFLAVLAIGTAAGLAPRRVRPRWWPSAPSASSVALSAPSASSVAASAASAVWPGLLTGVVALWASTGPSPSGGITIQHLPYDLLHEFVPGGRNVRVPARFVLLAAFFFAPVIAGGWAHVIGWIRRRWSGGLSGAMVAAAVVMVVAEALPELAWYEPASRLDARAVPDHLASGGVLFLPMSAAGGPRRDIERMWAARRSGLPLVNGYSGHSSLMFDKLAHLERVGSDDETRRALYSLLMHVDVDTIVVEGPAPSAVAAPVEGPEAALVDPAVLRQVGEGVYRIPADVRMPSIRTAPFGRGIGLLMTEAGWSYPETEAGDSWVWSLNRRATLLVPMDGTPRREIAFRARALHPDDEETLEVWWNGRSLGAQTLRGTSALLTFALPAAATRQGWARFEIRGPEPVSVRGSVDPRRLSVCVYEIAVR